MKKKMILGSVIGLAIFALAGCGQDLDLNFEGENMDVERVNEIIEDRLELENEGIDLEVHIVEEFEE